MVWRDDKIDVVYVDHGKDIVPSKVENRQKGRNECNSKVEAVASVFGSHIGMFDSKGMTAMLKGRWDSIDFSVTGQPDRTSPSLTIPSVGRL